jgi:translation initiation factor IF-2
MSLEDIFAQFQAGQAKHLNLILKTDVQGSIQPIVDGLEKMSGKNREGIQVRVLAADVGAVSESDVMLASAGDAESDKAIIIAFSTGVSNSAKNQAQVHGVEIREYDIIYKLFEDVEMETLSRIYIIPQLRQSALRFRSCSIWRWFPYNWRTPCPRCLYNFLYRY